MHCTPFKCADAEKYFFLILWTFYSGKEKVIGRFPLDVFKGTILDQSNYSPTEMQLILFYNYPWGFPLYRPDHSHITWKQNGTFQVESFDHVFVHCFWKQERKEKPPTHQASSEKRIVTLKRHLLCENHIVDRVRKTYQPCIREKKERNINLSFNEKLPESARTWELCDKSLICLPCFIYGLVLKEEECIYTLY